MISQHFSPAAPAPFSALVAFDLTSRASAGPRLRSVLAPTASTARPQLFPRPLPRTLRVVSQCFPARPVDSPLPAVSLL